MEDENEIAEALQSVARAIKYLGNGDAMTPMGGLEALGKVMSESIDGLAEAMREVAAAIREQSE